MPLEGNVRSVAAANSSAVDLVTAEIRRAVLTGSLDHPHFLLGAHAPGASTIASVTFVAILMTILIQAPTTQCLARRLGL